MSSLDENVAVNLFDLSEEFIGNRSAIDALKEYLTRAGVHTALSRRGALICIRDNQIYQARGKIVKLTNLALQQRYEKENQALEALSNLGILGYPYFGRMELGELGISVRGHIDGSHSTWYFSENDIAKQLLSGKNSMMLSNVAGSFKALHANSTRIIGEYQSLGYSLEVIDPEKLLATYFTGRFLQFSDKQQKLEEACTSFTQYFKKEVLEYLIADGQEVFCHADPNTGNVLISKSEVPACLLIDYERCGLGKRELDPAGFMIRQIANTFWELQPDCDIAVKKIDDLFTWDEKAVEKRYATEKHFVSEFLKDGKFGLKSYYAAMAFYGFLALGHELKYVAMGDPLDRERGSDGQYEARVWRFVSYVSNALQMIGAGNTLGEFYEILKFGEFKGYENKLLTVKPLSFD